MTDSSTTSSASLARVPAVEPGARPQLVVIGICDDLAAPSSRHVLDDIDMVRFGRGHRGAVRSTVDGCRVLELKIPDRRMSSNHGTLTRTPRGWVLSDPESKNGAVVDGALTRHATLASDTLFELGHTFLFVRDSVVEDGASVDAYETAEAPPALSTFDGALATKFAALARVAATNVSVIIQGETGTGKERVARALHDLSTRPGDFVAVNCGALPSSLVESELFGYRRGAFTGAISERLGVIRSADRGTLLLDEIGELPAAAQATLLRVLQEREVTPVGFDRPVKVDVRLCAATLRDLEQLVRRGQFREDLYARLFGFTLRLPPLRERRADFGALLRRLLEHIPGGSHSKLTPLALRTLIRHEWPFNIRELEKVLTTAIALAHEGVIDVAQLPDSLRLPISDERFESPNDARRAELIALLVEHNGNLAAVSKAMATRRTQVYRWLQRYRIRVEDYRR